MTHVVAALEGSSAGVALAATGRHFAVLTARGVPVSKGTVIDGFPSDVDFVGVPARTHEGVVRAEVESVRRYAGSTLFTGPPFAGAVFDPLEKVSLVMRHLEAIRALDPQPSFGLEVDA